MAPSCEDLITGSLAIGSLQKYSSRRKLSQTSQFGTIMGNFTVRVYSYRRTEIFGLARKSGTESVETGVLHCLAVYGLRLSRRSRPARPTCRR